MNFRVYGTPAPQGSKSAVVRGGRAVVIEGASSEQRTRHTNWRSAVADAAARAAEAHGGMIDGPVSVTVDFQFPMPKSRPAKVRDLVCVPKATAPDIDKLVRATLDGLVAGGLLKDDARVTALTATKSEVWESWTGCDIEVQPL